MTDTLETLTITVNDRPLTAWQSFSLTFGADQAVRTATADLAGPIDRDAFPFPDMPVTISAGQDLLLTGFVRDASPGHVEADGGQIWGASVSFVSKSVDATESSIVHESGELRDRDLVDVARTFESANVTWKSDGPLFDVPVFRVTPGRSTFAEIEELARSRGVLLYDDPEGAINLASKPAGRHAGGLALGVNILEGGAQFTGRYRHDPVIVRGQASRGSNEFALRPQATADNPALGRRRPLVEFFEGEPTTVAMQRRAEQEVTRREGASKSATVIATGWRDQDGLIWSPNFLVNLSDKWIFLEQDMLINGGTLEQNEDTGTRATLNLVDPRAMNGEDPKGEGDSYEVKKPKARIEAPMPPIKESELEPV